ncbi:hypothetical protein DSM106972_095550 [Dulcicalothrix desertica PCC 7102]|uniref:Uncharacterized protein n=1 Tax=Dulcicalothrix desertica PCC 7102 TaxID=232991 RepID=A0A433UIX0_9CYAN|nr:hypothetical protein [Dulcicalothrix desertica]RUS93796.1 hypothetical protein DSM106972_095550 [Dulcicalothrix desertica PCC 7102]TWH62725.1 hypothetical protein CAL7102_00242 [Dulcicalothrix desertica PCC 7102]
MNELTSYKEFHDLLRLGKTPLDLGFVNNISVGDIARFASRYNMAKSCKGIILEGFTDKTTEGYGGLIKLSLCWSTFEQFLEIRGLQQKDTKELFDAYNAAALCEEIKTYDKKKAFYSFIYPRVKRSHQSEIDKLFASQELNSSYLVSGIRHIFVHGYLSPHAGGSQPKNVVKICNIISEFVLYIIDSEFSKQINSYLVIN